MREESRYDSVGWIFFSVATLLSLGPAIYVIFQITIDSTPISMRIGSGLFLAGFAAAILSWIANSILGYIADRREGDAPETDAENGPVESKPAEEKPAKKKKKKK